MFKAFFFKDNFTSGDVISMHMRKMSFAFKNERICLVDHWSYMATLENQKSYNNIQTSRILFS